MHGWFVETLRSRSDGCNCLSFLLCLFKFSLSHFLLMSPLSPQPSLPLRGPNPELSSLFLSILSCGYTLLNPCQEVARLRVSGTEHLEGEWGETNTRDKMTEKKKGKGCWTRKVDGRVNHKVMHSVAEVQIGFFLESIRRICPPMQTQPVSLGDIWAEWVQ